MDIQNKRISDQEFAKLRQEVLAQWPTGQAVDLEEAVAYHKAMPASRLFSKTLSDVYEEDMLTDERHKEEQEDGSGS